MMGGGVCWLDYDGDGRLDLYVVDTYAESDVPGFSARGGLPTSRLYRNLGGRFEDVTAADRRGPPRPRQRAAPPRTSTATARPTSSSRPPATTPAATPTTPALEQGDGTFTEGAWHAGVRAFGWHTGRRSPT